MTEPTHINLASNLYSFNLQWLATGQQGKTGGIWLASWLWWGWLMWLDTFCGNTNSKDTNLAVLVSNYC